MEYAHLIILGVLAFNTHSCKTQINDQNTEFVRPEDCQLKSDTNSEREEHTTDPISSIQGCYYEGELNEENDYSKEIKLDFDSSLLDDKAPFINTKIINLPIEYKSLETNTFMDVIAYTNTGPSLWSFTEDHLTGTVSRYLYISKPKNDDKPSVKLVFSTTTKLIVKFNFTLEFRDISITMNITKDLSLTYGSPLIYKYENKDNKTKRIRVHVARNDIDELRKKTSKREGCSAADPTTDLQMAKHLCSCSIVTIQKLETPFNQFERDVVFDSVWQTMIGRSVIDIDVGPEEKKYKDGFYIVILKKQHDAECQLSNLDLSLDGQSDDEETDDAIEVSEVNSNCTKLNENGTAVESVILESNCAEAKTATIRLRESVHEFTMEVTEMDNDIVEVSLIILGIYLGILIVMLILSRVIRVPITGKVIVKEKPFSVIFNICVKPKLPESNKVSDNVDSTKQAKDTKNENNESPLEMEQLSKLSRKRVRRNLSLDSETIRNANCFYIEMCDSSEEEVSEQEKDAVDGNAEDEHIEILEMTSRIKTALNIEKKQAIRVVAKTQKKKLRLKRIDKEPALSDFTTSCDPTMFPKTLYMKSDMYYWIMMLTGAFYILPALQLMLGANYISSQTGSQDLCYYNFLCRRTSKLFQDYGHLYSNVAYLFCGVFFIILVFIRSYRRKNKMVEMYCEKNHPSWDLSTKKKLRDARTKLVENGRNVEFLNQCGIPEQYGIFFAMGAALFMEGILSGAYHVCPIDQSFQFDTTFMYIIMVLVFMKLYQFRHPDITANAYIVFAVMAIMLAFEAIGYYSPVGVYMFCFVFTYVFVVFAFLIDMYFQKNFRLAMKEIFCAKEEEDQGNPRNYKKELKTGSTARTVFFIVMGFVNILVAIFFLYKMALADDSVVSNYLMLVFGVNMFGYMIYYMIMKCYYVVKRENSAESLTFTCWVYILLTAIFLVVSMYYFKAHQEKTTNISPSESRHLNDVCTVWFFDKHDIWHFFGAFGLLFLFMSILTLEDNNTSTLWTKIPVF